jgi:predicted nucleic acid-binding protein
MIYLDTSALIKRFAAEKGSERVHRMIAKEGPIATAKIAYAEVHSGLARKMREGTLSASRHAFICRQVETEWPAYLRMDLTDEVLSRARQLIHRHPLRAFDAIHLASALILKAGLGEQVDFVSGDQRQLLAATKEELGALNIESS